MATTNVKPAVRSVLDYVAKNADALAGVCYSLFWFGEPAMQEDRSAALLRRRAAGG